MATQVAHNPPVGKEGLAFPSKRPLGRAQATLEGGAPLPSHLLVALYKNITQSRAGANLAASFLFSPASRSGVGQPPPLPHASWGGGTSRAAGQMPRMRAKSLGSSSCWARNGRSSEPRDGR